MKEAPFLMPVSGIIRRIHIQNDLGRRRVVGLQKKIHQQIVHRLRMRHNLLVTACRISIQRGSLQTVQRALARQGTAFVLSTASILTCRVGHVAEQCQ